MSKVDELIAELCPDGVEYKRLGGINGICEVLPSGVDKVFAKNERPVKLCNYMDVYNNQYITDELIDGFMDGSVNESEYQKFVLRAGQVLLTKDSETREDIAQSAYVFRDFDNVVCGYHLAVLTPKSNIDGKYLNYVLQSNSIRHYFSKMANGVSRFGLKLKSIEDALIPIPPLQVQQEIVRILDKFTKLEAELEARKKQYGYYRDLLLNFDGLRDDTVQWLTLGNVCSSISAGGDLPKNYQKGQLLPSEEYPYPIFANATDSNGLYGYTDNYKIDSDAITISARGAKVGFHTTRVAKFTPIIRLLTLIPNANIVTTEYLNFVLDITPISGTSGGIPQITVPTVSKIQIPVPSLEEQQRIVAILDRFDALCNDLTSGLRKLRPGASSTSITATSCSPLRRPYHDYL